MLRTVSHSNWKPRLARFVMILLLAGILNVGNLQSSRAWPAEMTVVWSSEVADTADLAWGDLDGDGYEDLAVAMRYARNLLYRNTGGDLELIWTADEEDQTTSLAWADWDDDGDLDLAVGNNPGYARIYRNEGGVLTSAAAWSTPDELNTESIAWSDFDGDGFPDLALGNNGQPNRVYKNSSGTLALFWEGPASDPTTAVDWGDFDDDGELELAVGNWQAVTTIYDYDGSGFVPAWTAPLAQKTMSVDFGDWDNDGFAELAVGNWQQPTRVYAYAAGAPVLAWESWVDDLTTVVKWGDWNGDGQLDLGVGNDWGVENAIYVKEGAGLRLAWTSYEHKHTQALDWSDWDLDGDLDLAAGNFAQTDDVYSQGETMLAEAWLSNELDESTDAAWADWDGDGDLDLAFANRYGPNRIYENRDLQLVLAWSSDDFEYSTSLAWGDYDRDGDLDLAVGNGRPQDDEPGIPENSRVYRNDGATFTLAWTAPFQETTQSLAWGDYDRDGDLDLALGNANMPNRVYCNLDGTLVFGAPACPGWLAPVSEATYSVAWGDLDNDGDLDLAVGNGSPLGEDEATAQANRVYRNTGTGFQSVWVSAEKDVTDDLAWGDFDGDGDLDLAAGNNGQNRLYRNVAGVLGTAAYFNFPFWDTTADLSWGDWDGDGDLDLAVANTYGRASRIYTNRDGSLVPSWISPATDSTTAAVWGDYDGDGDLDLAIANNYHEPNRIYANTNRGLLSAWVDLPYHSTRDVAWGDANADGWPDLATAGYDQENGLYLNDHGVLTPTWISSTLDSTFDQAWGDWDGDGDLDLAAGNLFHANQVFENQGGVFTPAWTAGFCDETHSLAWGDWDNDGDLDLAVGNYDEQNYVYANTGAGLSLAWASPTISATQEIAWGDWDNDGDLDLAVANGPDDADEVFENTGGDLRPAWTSLERESSTALAWADWDSDGDLDLAIAGEYRPIRWYENRGADLVLAWRSAEIKHFSSLAWGDWDLDGDLDLAAGSAGYASNYIYRNDGARFKMAWSSAEWEDTVSLEWGDWDLDGDPDLAVGSVGEPTRVYRNRAADRPALASTETFARIDFPAGAAANGYASAVVLSGPTLPLRYTLFDAEGDPARLVKAYFSLDGGSTWQPALPAPGTITQNLAASAAGVAHTFDWDVYASNVFGASDTALFRLEVYQGFDSPGPYLYPFRRAQTLPFRLRGSQVRVETATGAPAAQALVYRLPAGDSGAFEPYTDLFGRPYYTNPAGYLQGYGEIYPGDQLVALHPVAATQAYTLYHTSAAPSLSGVEPFTVSTLGVQNLTVSSDNPLLLFNLDVSLEWDARQDPEFLNQLGYDLERTSELLYDWTDGQAALGRVTVYHARQAWTTAGVRIYASNRLRPSGAQGGVVDQTLADPGVPGLDYAPGQVFMGPAWNRFGDPGGTLGEDWPRALAHELGHYLFFLDDNYLGRDAAGLVQPVEACPGAMADPYRDDDLSGYDEFHPAAGWLPACQDTLSNQATGRDDWSTLTTFYPQLHAPLPANYGPNRLPLAVTRVTFVDPPAPDDSLPAPYFHLTQSGSRLIPGPEARAFLFHDGLLTDLGRPELDLVLARGARPGDRLCVFEPPAARLGCETVAAGDDQLALLSVSGWQPEVRVTPVSSYTIPVAVYGLPPGLGLQAQLYPSDGPAVPAQALSESGGVYRTTFQLTDPAPAGAVHVWVAEPDPRREIVAEYALGGGPAMVRGGSGRHSPAISPDGQVILYAPPDVIPENEFVTLQAATLLPARPAGTTPVGRAFWLSASAGVGDLTQASLTFNYLGAEAPPGTEPWLRVFFYDPGTSAWTPLETTLDTGANFASARVRGAGLYALLSTLEFALSGPGWDDFYYPFDGALPVAEALASIQGYYNQLCRFDAALPSLWECYGPEAPAWTGEFDTLTASGYWIYVTQDVTLRLEEPQAAAQALPPGPPATYYGFLIPGEFLQPAPGQTLTAWIDGHPCGQAETLAVGAQTGFVIHVLSDDGTGFTGCGASGRQVSFRLDGQPLGQTAAWDNSRFHPFDLAAPHLYLPYIGKP